jgi:2-keto-4-pentenoate hydratase/2-oxohepta-3-ene-1,7-dioic acid hydratase in catechol pathway
VQLLHLPDGGIGALSGSELRDLSEVLADYGCIDDIVSGGPGAWAEVERAIPSAPVVGDGLPSGELPPPVLAPSKIVCVGLNYRAHREETALEAPAEPLLFAKFPSSLTGHLGPISWPSDLTRQVDWEAELAVIIGSPMRNVSEETALDHVFGYTIANDVSARDLQFGDGQWTRGKSLDTFCPLGPTIVSANEIGDPQQLDIALHLNGEAMQASNTSKMIFPVAAILASVSHAFTLNPGDLVLTGTPEGVGAFRDEPIYLRHGDVVTISIERLGTLTNPVAAPSSR